MITKMYHYLDSIYNKKYFLLVYRLDKLFLNFFLPIYYKFTSRNKLDKHSKTIVSLTSFPARINRVYLVIESLLRQTVMPSKIVLYLSKQEFDGFDVLPSKLKRLCSKGLLQVCLEDENLRPHNKYYFAVRDYSEFDIITVDDDIFYPEDFIEGLCNTHNSFPDSVCCNYASIMRVEDNKFAPYSTWEDCKTPEVELNNLLPKGVGGVYYPQNIFDKRILLDKELLLTLCPAADDLWLRCNTILNRKTVVKAKNYDNNIFIDILIRNNIRLCDSNVTENKNDEQLSKIKERFPEMIVLIG